MSKENDPFHEWRFLMGYFTINPQLMEAIKVMRRRVWMMRKEPNLIMCKVCQAHLIANPPAVFCCKCGVNIHGIPFTWVTSGRGSRYTTFYSEELGKKFLEIRDKSYEMGNLLNTPEYWTKDWEPTENWK